MDVRFPVWLSLHLKNKEDIKKRVNQIQKLFADDQITNEMFTADGLDLLKQVNDWLYDDEGKLRADEARKPTTIAHDIEVIGYYTRFQGYSYPGITALVAKAGVDARHTQQATISMTIQDPSRALNTVKQVIDKLRSRQTVINARIHRWLVLGNLDTDETLITFGTRELRPFLELALRYTYLPLSMARVDKMGITTARTLPQDAEFWTGTAMPLAESLMLRDNQFVHVSVAFPNGRSTDKDHAQGRIVVRPVGQALSVYIYFYDTYCKGEPDSKHRRTIKTTSFRPLFTGRSGGQMWKNMRQDTETYAYEQLQLPRETIEAMGIRDRNYHPVSLAQWVACRAHLQNIDASTVAADVHLADSGFRAESKFYPGLRSLRAREDAVEGILGIQRHEPVVNNIFTLLNIPTQLDSLQQEIAHRHRENSVHPS